jgi:hypothetical protein
MKETTDEQPLCPVCEKGIVDRIGRRAQRVHVTGIAR